VKNKEEAAAAAGRNENCEAVDGTRTTETKPKSCRKNGSVKADEADDTSTRR
jgi:hypothetical protein